MRLALLLPILVVLIRTEETTEKEAEREPRQTEEIIVTEDESQLSDQQLDAQDEPLRSTLHNGPLSQTVTELGGRPILSQAFDLGKATANEPYRIVRRERLRLPTYVHDVLGGVTPQPLPFPYPLPYPYPPYPLPYPPYPYPSYGASPYGGWPVYPAPSFPPHP